MCLEPSELCDDDQQFRDLHILHHSEYCGSNCVDCTNQNYLDKNLKNNLLTSKEKCEVELNVKS